MKQHSEDPFLDECLSGPTGYYQMIKKITQKMIPDNIDRRNEVIAKVTAEVSRLLIKARRLYNVHSFQEVLELLDMNSVVEHKRTYGPKRVKKVKDLSGLTYLKMTVRRTVFEEYEKALKYDQSRSQAAQFLALPEKRTSPEAAKVARVFQDFLNQGNQLFGYAILRTAFKSEIKNGNISNTESPMKLNTPTQKFLNKLGISMNDFIEQNKQITNPNAEYQLRHRAKRAFRDYLARALSKEGFTYLLLVIGTGIMMSSDALKAIAETLTLLAKSGV